MFRCCSRSSSKFLAIRHHLESSSLSRENSVWMIQLSKANLSSDSLIISLHCPYRSRRHTLINFKVFFSVCTLFDHKKSHDSRVRWNLRELWKSNNYAGWKSQFCRSHTVQADCWRSFSSCSIHLEHICCWPVYKSINVHYSRTGCFSFNFSPFQDLSLFRALIIEKHQQYHRWRLNRKKPVCESSRESLSLIFFRAFKELELTEKHKVIKQSLCVQAQSEELICSPHQRERRPNGIFFFLRTHSTHNI